MTFVPRLSISPSVATLVAVLLLVFPLVTGCGGEARVEDGPAIEPRRPYAKAEAASSKRPTRNLDPRSLRNMSELIAGFLPESAAGEASEVWVDHARFMDEAWQQIDERMAKMRQWAGAELGDVEAPQAPLFYPFGGPDLISAMQFFPDAGSYLLVGLEAPGFLPLPEAFEAAALAGDLERLRRPFESFVDSGYFVRTEIERELDGGSFDGILPIVLICLVRAGQTPLAVDYVQIDPETVQISPLPPDSDVASAVRIKFAAQEPAEEWLRAMEEGTELPDIRTRAVYYFAQDLSDSGLLSEEPFRRLIEHQPAVNSYIKSGMYLAHTEDFSSLRKLMLGKTQTLLQDDSGLPIKYLRSDRWDMRLYGQYTGVLAAYSQWYQEDLAAAFAKPDVKALEFTAGYNTISGGGLIVAHRRGAEAPHSAE